MNKSVVELVMVMDAIQKKIAGFDGGTDYMHVKILIFSWKFCISWFSRDFLCSTPYNLVAA